MQSIEPESRDSGFALFARPGMTMPESLAMTENT
jgi:hypothetical protein